MNTFVAATVYVVDAALVVIAAPSVTKLLPSSEPSRTTEPAETPADVVTVATAVARTTRPSKTVPGPVADTADSDTSVFAGIQIEHRGVAIRRCPDYLKQT